MPDLPPAEASNLGILVTGVLSLVTDALSLGAKASHYFAERKQTQLESTLHWLEGLQRHAPDLYDEYWTMSINVTSDEKKRWSIFCRRKDQKAPDEEKGEEVPPEKNPANVSPQEGQQAVTGDAGKTPSGQEEGSSHKLK